MTATPYIPDPQWVADTVARTRTEQGLHPTKAEDPLVYERTAALVGPWWDERAAQRKPARKRPRAA